MLQDIYQQSVSPKYPVGLGMTIGENRYHYSRAAHAISNLGTYRLAVTTDQILAINDLLSVAPAAAVGDKIVTVAVGSFQGGAVTVNELVNGYIEIWPVAGGAQFMYRRIMRNTAVSAGKFTITVDKPFNFAIGVSSLVTVHPSIYRAVKSAFDAGLTNYQVAVGLPPIPVDNGYYFWLLTYGKCFIAPTGVWPLAESNSIDVYMHSDGCINSSKNESIGTANSPQRVGHAIGAGLYGCGQTMLELDAS